MRHYSQVAAAVAVALASASAGAANNITWGTSLVIAGSSAMRDAVANELSTVLCPGNLTTYKGATGSAVNQEPAPDFRAYVCSGSAAAAGLGGGSFVVYYRSEGGSIFGVFGNSALNSGTALQINRLNIGPSGGAQPANFKINENVTSLQADNQTGAVTKDIVQLGISDANPTAFVGGNYGSEYSFITYPQPTSTQLQALPSGRIVGEVYAPIVSNASGNFTGFSNTSTGLGTSGLTSLEVASIISGSVSDWSKIPSAKTAGATAGETITLCRRDQGSGTQIVTSTHFLGQTCSSGGLPYVTTTTAGATPVVVTNYSTNDVLLCVNSNPGAIGFVTLQVPTNVGTLTNGKYIEPAGQLFTGAPAISVTQIPVDGVQPTAINAASGLYTYYGEAYYIKDNATYTGNAKTLGNAILADIGNASKTPASATDPNLVGISTVDGNVAFSPVTPFASGQQIPIAIDTNGGNVCTPFTTTL